MTVFLAALRIDVATGELMRLCGTMRLVPLGLDALSQALALSLAAGCLCSATCALLLVPACLSLEVACKSFVGGRGAQLFLAVFTD